MSTPAIIWCVLAGMTLVAKCLTHGKQTPVNAFLYILFDLPLAVGLLYWGGFFS